MPEQPRVRDSSSTDEPVLEVRHLTKRYHVGGFFSNQYLHAVDDVSFEVAPSETLALVGESGSGKSTAARTLLRLEEPDAGEVLLEGRSITAATDKELRRMRARMQIVFQDPYESLNPRMRVEDQVAEPLWLSGQMSRQQATQRVRELLQLVQLPEDAHRRLPHQFSGGQQQRVGIARALSTEPALVILDEPTSALDVSVQSQILNLLQNLQEKLSLAFLFISHDLHVVRHLANRVAVMYLGQIVEVGPTDVIFDEPGHPYTRALISAAPVDHPNEERERIVLQGEPPSPINPQAQCRLASRCPFVKSTCVEGNIELVQVADGHWVRCSRFAEEHRNGAWEPEPSQWRLPSDESLSRGQGAGNHWLERLRFRQTAKRLSEEESRDRT
jgi:oligopeptide/dipeptide ABC transporter ATP-binding protein